MSCGHFIIVFALVVVAVRVSTHLFIGLSPFYVPSVAVSRPCRLSEFYPIRSMRASKMAL